MSYKQLTLQQRYHISAFRNCGYSQKEIARELGVSPSTISRELRRNVNLDGHYHPEYAEVEARSRQQRKRKYTAMTSVIERYVRSKLKEEWSPEQIAGRMHKEKGWKISHETIYRFIYRNKANGAGSTDTCVIRTRSITDVPLRKINGERSPEEWESSTDPGSWRRSEESEIGRSIPSSGKDTKECCLPL